MSEICASIGGNVGKPGCDVPLGAIYHILPTQGAEFTAADLADSAAFRAALKTKLLAVRGTSSKIYVFPYANESEPTTGDRVTASLADGFEKTLLDAVPKYVLRGGHVNLFQQQAMCAFNGFSGKSYFVDRNNILFYLIKSDGGGKGFNVSEIYTNPPGFGGTAALNPAITNITMGDVNEWKIGPIGALKLDFNINDVASLEDVVMVEKAAQSTNVFTIGAKAKYSQVDIYDAYSTALANTARWVAKNKATGAAISITTVTADAANKGWDITLDSTAYTALGSGTKISINIADPATLEAAGVTGIEGIEIVYTKS